MQYQLDCLKSICSCYLITTLNVETVAEVLVVADMHQASELKTKCIDFITDHSSQVMATKGWSALTGNRIELVTELFQNLAIKTGR